MKNLLTAFVSVLFISELFALTQSTVAENTVLDDNQAWIQSLLREQDSSIISNDYIFYCTGHHGIIWSLITSDSSGVHLYNGTTRHDVYKETGLQDTLSFIEDNINTIVWGFDSVSDAAELVKPINNPTYNPIYNQIYVVKNGKITFKYNDVKDYYIGKDSKQFNKKLGSLVFLMFWLASPSCRPYMPRPNDTLLH